jgi:hypothetical protein
MDERVTLYAPAPAGEGDYGEHVAGEAVEVGAVRASVTPEDAGERVAADRIEGTVTFTVRVDLVDVARADRERATATYSGTAPYGSAENPAYGPPDASWHVVWERSADRGGPLTLQVAGAVPYGALVDLLCTSNSPAGGPS